MKTKKYRLRINGDKKLSVPVDHIPSNGFGITWIKDNAYFKGKKFFKEPLIIKYFELIDDEDRIYAARYLPQEAHIHVDKNKDINFNWTLIIERKIK